MILILLNTSVGCSAGRYTGCSRDSRTAAGLWSSATAHESAVSGLTGQTIAPLGKGEGVLVVEDAGGYEVHPL